MIDINKNNPLSDLNVRVAPVGRLDVFNFKKYKLISL